ncbi:cupredoxin family copper-binding protein [Candidatus Saccharibacteria bacterium]|nr:cupredoxin family copper-binding protein [Candidatus Saccharibacteria bacterium]
MKKFIIIALIAVIAVVGISSLLKKDKGSDDMSTMNMNSSETADTETATAPNAVSIEDFAFKQANISVKKGTTVTWTNNDDAKHNVTPEDATDDFKEGPLLAKGETYSVTFNTVGSYSYNCSPHPYMKGVVEVTE